MYLRIAETYSKLVDGKQCTRKKVIKNIGYQSKFDDGRPEYFKRLRQSFKDGNPIIKSLEQYIKKDKVNISFDLNNSYLNVKNIGYIFIDSFIKKLGVLDVAAKYKSNSKLSFDLVGIIKLLICGRILKPESKISTLKQNNNYLIPPIKDNLKNDKNIYKTLDCLNELSIKIQKRLNYKLDKSKDFKHNNELLFYDVTNYYFEIEDNDTDIVNLDNKVIEEGLRKKGVSKEKRPNPIVQMGLFMDNNSIPISYKLFPGNKIDQTTLLPILNQTNELIKNYKKTIVVADMGVNSDKNICTLLENNKGYIVAKSVKSATKEYKDWILDNKGYKNMNNKIPTEVSEFKYKSKIFKRTIINKDGIKQTITEKRVCFFSYAHYLKEVKDHSKFLDYLEKCENNPNLIKSKKYKVEQFFTKETINKKTGEKLKNTKQKISINEEKLKYYKDLMGYYMVCTSEIDKDDLKIISNYKELSKIENSFRVVKSDLLGRPVFVKTKEHINAHFLICFISLLIMRLFQIKLCKKYPELKTNSKNKYGYSYGITAQNIQTTLNGFYCNQMQDGYLNLSKPSNELIKLAESLGVDIKDLPSILDISVIQKLIYQLSKIEL